MLAKVIIPRPPCTVFWCIPPRILPSLYSHQSPILAGSSTENFSFNEFIKMRTLTEVINKVNVSFFKFLEKPPILAPWQNKLIGHVYEGQNTNSINIPYDIDLNSPKHAFIMQAHARKSQTCRAFPPFFTISLYLTAHVAFAWDSLTENKQMLSASHAHQLWLGAGTGQTGKRSYRRTRTSPSVNALCNIE